MPVGAGEIEAGPGAGDTNVGSPPLLTVSSPTERRAAVLTTEIRGHRGFQPELVRHESLKLGRIIEGAHRGGEDPAGDRRDKHGIPFEPLSPVDCQEHDGIFRTNVCRIQLGCRLVVGDQVQVSEECLKCRSASQRTPLLRQIQESIEVDPGCKRRTGIPGFYLVPYPGLVEDSPAQVHQRRSLGIPQETSVQRPEPGQLDPCSRA